MSNTAIWAFLLALTVSASAQAPFADDLAGRAVERRGIEATIWGVPAVNFWLMYGVDRASALRRVVPETRFVRLLLAPPHDRIVPISASALPPASTNATLPTNYLPRL